MFKSQDTIIILVPLHSCSRLPKTDKPFIKGQGGILPMSLIVNFLRGAMQEAMKIIWLSSTLQTKAFSC